MLTEILSNKEDVNLETQRKHKSLVNQKRLKQKGELITKHEDLQKELTEDRDFFIKENQELDEKSDKQKVLIKNFYNMQKQQYSRI